MEKSIVGAYDSSSEVMNVINSLTKDGYTEDDILVISKREDSSSLDNTSGLHVEHPEETHESMWAKIKDAFTVHEHGSSDSDLSQYGIPNNQVGTYQSKLDEGQIILAVTAKDKYELGHGGDVKSGATIEPLKEDEETYRNSPTAGKSIGNHGAEPGDVRSGNVDTSEDTIGGNVGNTLGGKLGTSEGYPTGEEPHNYNKEPRHHEKRENLNEHKFNKSDVNDY